MMKAGDIDTIFSHTPDSQPLGAAVDGLPSPRRAWAFFVLAIAMTMAVLDAAIVNIALPTIANTYQVSPEATIWIVNAYQLAIAMSLLPLAALGDSVGYTRVYLVGLAVFSMASLACAFAPSLDVLIAARMVQGLGAASVMSVNVAIVRYIYPRDKLGQGVGNMAVIVATSSAIGPSVGAAILSISSWHWLFLINVPIGALAIALGMRTLPNMPRSGKPIDPLSVVLNAVALGLLITGVDRLGNRNQVGLALAELAGAVVVGTVLARRQFGLKLPILPVDLLRMPVFALSLATSIASFASQAITLVSLPFYFEGVRHMTDAQTGLLLTPWPVATALIAPVAGRLADRMSPGRLGGVGMLVEAVGLALLATAPLNASSVDLAWRLFICGLGFGFFQSPNNRLIIGSAPANRTGGASGLQSTGRLIGQSVGVAVLAIIFARGFAGPVTIALWLSCGLAVLAGIVSGLRR